MTSRRPRPWVVPAALVALLTAAPSAPAQINWNLAFLDTGSGVGFDDPSLGATRQATLAAVTSFLNTQLDARGTINLQIQPSVTQPGAGFLSFGGSRFALRNGFANGLTFQRATTNATGFPPADGDAQFNFASDVNWNYGTGVPAANQYDLFSITLHEFTHALGFLTRVSVTGQGVNANPLGQLDGYADFDRYLKRGFSNTFLVTSPAAFNVASGALPSDLSSNDLFFDGPIARAANDGLPVKLFAPATYQNGVNVSHTDPATPTLSTSVMLPSVSPGTMKRKYAKQDLAILIDIGWNNFTWTNATGGWADNVSSTANSRWQNTDAQAMLSPVGSITTNLILRFGGSGSASYTSTNNLDLSAKGNAFLINRLILNSSSSATNTITVPGSGPGANNRLQFGTTIEVQPQIQQLGSGAFNVTHPVEVTAPFGLELTGDGTGLVVLGGVVSGAGGLSKTGSSTYVLAAANSYVGTTTVSAGTLRLAGGGSIASSPLVTVGTAAGGTAVLDVGVTGGANFNAASGGFALAGGQTLAGHGTVTGPVRVGAGTIVSPGTSPGTLTVTGTTTFAPAGRYVWELNSVAGSATTQDRLAVNGALNISGLSAAGPFIIAVTSLTPANAPGPVGDFSNSTSYQWPLVTYATLTGTFNSNLFVVDTTSFANAVPAGSVFSVGQSGNSLVLNYSPVPEPAHVLLACAAGGLGLLWFRRMLTPACPAGTGV